MNRGLAVSVLCLSLAACATEKSAPEPAQPAPPDVSVQRTIGPLNVTAESKLEFAQALIDLDHFVDRFVFIGSQPGEEARSERNLLAPAIAAQVKQFRTQLLAAAGDTGNPERRRTAVKALAFSDDPAAVPLLTAALSERGDARLLTNATFALGRIHSPSTAVEPLLAAVRDPDPDVRSNALLALGRIFDARRAAGQSPADPAVTQTAMPLFETALLDTSDPVVRAHAAAALGALGNPAGVDPLLNLLRDGHPLVRMHTAIALAKLSDKKAIPALVQVIDQTPAGSPRKAVLLSLTTLLEAQGHTVPPTIGDDQRAWERLVQETMGTK